MGKELIAITFKAKIKPVKPINEQFTLCKCFVMAIGKNVNKTIILKESVDDALPTLFNIPVVGHLYIDENGEIRLGGHDIILEKNADGKYKFKSVTVPYGTVPQQDNVHYEEVEEADGTKNVYLVADIILWTGRYPELLDTIYNEDIYFAQSMEIMPSDTKKTSDGLEVKKFQFSALCLLGKSDDPSKNVLPCFKSARVEPYKFSDEGNWIELFAEFKEQLAKSYSAVDVVKGGKEALNTETIKKILLEFGLAEDTVLSFEVAEEMTEDELREKIKEVYSQDNQTETPTEDNTSTDGTTEDGEPAGDPVQTTETFSDNREEPAAEPAAEPTNEEPLKFSVELTYEEKRRVLCEALGSYEMHDEKSYIWYCLVDFDDTYVYSCFHFAGAEVAEERGMIRIPYAISDDKAILDMARNEKVRQVWLTKADEEKLSAEKAQFAELAQYKADRLQEDKRQSYAAVIEQFSDLGEVDEYKAVVKEAMTFESVEALTEKLYAIRGKNAGTIVKKPLDKVRIPVGFEAKTKQSEYDEFMSRYLAPKK